MLTSIDPALLSDLSRKGLHPFHDGAVWVLGLPPELQVSV